MQVSKVNAKTLHSAKLVFPLLYSIYNSIVCRKSRNQDVNPTKYKLEIKQFFLPYAGENQRKQLIYNSITTIDW